MLLYNGIITLDYNPATDVLATELPDVRQFGLLELRFCLDLIVKSVINYDIKQLLLDSSHSVVGIEDEAHRAVTADFGTDLMKTRLRRIARVGAADAAREEKAARVAHELRQELPIKVRTFPSRNEAMGWLQPLEQQSPQPKTAPLSFHNSTSLRKRFYLI